MVDIERYDNYTEAQITEKKRLKSRSEFDGEAQEVFTEAFYDRILTCDTFQEHPSQVREENLRAYQEAIHRLFEPLDVSDRCMHRDIIKPVKISLGYNHPDRGWFSIEVENYRIYRNIFGRERKELCGRDISQFNILFQIDFAEACKFGLIPDDVIEEDFEDILVVRDLRRAMSNLRVALEYEGNFYKEKGEGGLKML